MALISLVLGGARSGKSRRALALAARPPHAFIATAEALDAEMSERIARHKAERGPDWRLREEPLDLRGALAAEAGEDAVVLIDCLTLWLSNLLHHGRDPEAETDALIAALAAAPGWVVLVSNEVGLGITPVNALARAFVDAQGRLNSRLAAEADHVEFLAAGLPLVLKGAAPAWPQG